jgi:hypothetical protein
MVSIDIDNNDNNNNDNDNDNNNNNDNDNNNDNNNFGGIKFAEETDYFNNLVYNSEGVYIGFVIAESYCKFFLNSGQDNNGNPIGSFIYKHKENLEWFMTYEN